MAAQPAPCWGSLPAELLARVFDAEGPPALLSLRVAGYGPPTLVLSIEERARAEVVCKHWRAALSSHPATYSSLALGPKHFAKDLQQGRARAIRRALGAAAKVPVVQHIRLWASGGDNPALVEANNAALQPMLSCKCARALSVVLAGTDSLLAYLPTARQYSSLEHLHLVELWEALPFQLCLEPRPGLPSMDHVRRLEVKARNADIALSLPMPRLERMAVRAAGHTVSIRTPAPPPSPGAAASGSGGSVAAAPVPPFPALRTLDIIASHVELGCAATPGLEELRLTLYTPPASVHLSSPSLLSRLTSLHLAAVSSGRLDTWWMYDLHVCAPIASNTFSGLLTAAALSLRCLSITLEEPLNADMAGALRALSGLTRLDVWLRSHQITAPMHWDCVDWDAEEGMEGGAGPAWGAPGGLQLAGGGTLARVARTRLDCWLLAGMAGLQELGLFYPDGSRLGSVLDNPAALEGRTSLRSLWLQDASVLPALAPHLPPGLSRLELARTRAADLEEQHIAALAALPGLRALVLGGRPDWVWIFGSQGVLDAAWARHVEVIQALEERLPGCDVEARLPNVDPD